MKELFPREDLAEMVLKETLIVLEWLSNKLYTRYQQMGRTREIQSNFGGIRRKVEGVSEDEGVEESLIAEFGFGLVIKFVTLNPESSLKQLHHKEALPNIIKRCLLMNSNTLVKERVAVAITTLILETSKVIPHHQTLDVYLIRTFLHRFMEDALSTLEDRDTETFFTLLNNLVENCSPEILGIEKLLKSGDYINGLSKRITHREIKEGSPVEIDIPLNGIMKLISNILKKTNDITLFTDSHILTTELLTNCLFKFPTRKNLLKINYRGE